MEAQAAKNRPASANVFAALNVVLGVLWTLSAVSTLLAYVAPRGREDPILQIVLLSPGYLAYLKAASVMRLAAVALLVAAGVGLTRLAEWGRKLSLACGVYGVTFGIANTVLGYLYVLRPMLRGAAELGGPVPLSDKLEVIAGGWLSLVYAVLLIVFMTRPGLKAAFVGQAGRRGGQPAPGEAGPGRPK